MIARRTLWAILATWLLALSAWAQSPLIEVWKDVYAVPLVRDHFTVQRGDIIPYRVHLIDSSFNPIPMDQATRSAAVQVLYEPGITARVYSATLYASAAIIQADPTINLLPGDYILQSVLYEEPGHTIIMIGSEENLTITPKPDISFGDIAFTNINDFTAYVSNQVALSVSNQVLVILTNNINVGQTFVSNYIANVISNFVDATVTVPGLTVNVSNIKIPIENILTPGIPSGAVIRADGNALYADTNYQANVLVRWGTNNLGYASTLHIGAGLLASVSDGTASVALAGMNFPGASGVTLTNVHYFINSGRTGEWYQTSAGSTSHWVQLIGGGGGGGSLSGGGGGGVRMRFNIAPLSWIYAEVSEAPAIGTNTTGAAEYGPSTWPGGGRGASRTINYIMRSSGGYTALWDGVPDRVTFSNLIAIAAGGSSYGMHLPSSVVPPTGGGGMLGIDGNANGTSYLGGRGATETDNGAFAINSSFAGMAITGSPPAQLQGGDAQLATNSTGAASGGSPGYFSGSGGYAAGGGNNASGGNGGTGSSWINPKYGVGEVSQGANIFPPYMDHPLYRNLGVQYGAGNMPGLGIIADIVEVP